MPKEYRLVAPIDATANQVHQANQCPPSVDRVDDDALRERQEADRLPFRVRDVGLARRAVGTVYEDLLLGDLEPDGSVIDVDGDRVAVSHRGQGAPIRRFR